MEIVDHKPVL